MRGIFALLALAMPAIAQDLVTVRVFSTAPQSAFRVDGARFTRTAVFVWPAGSKHTLQAELLEPGVSAGIRHRFTNWESPAGPLAASSPVVSITADPLLPWFELKAITEFAISLRFNNCGGTVCAAPGTIWADQVPFTQDAEIWKEARSSMVLEAAANPGYIFAGWSYREGLPFVHTLTVTQPLTVSARFLPARPVTLRTEPEGLRVMADRVAVVTPTTLDWGLDTVHTLGPVSPQVDNVGRTWIFQGWADGGEATRAYRVEPVAGPVSVTARYIPGIAVTLFTSPEGLALKVDGAETRAPQTFTWGTGERHTIAAPERQVDARGVPYVFRGWLDGGDAERTLTVSAPERLTAVYEALGVLTLETSPLSLSLEVDGKPCASPCRVERARGEKVLVAAASTSPVDDGNRFDFTGWSDGAAREREFTLGDPRRVTAVYTAMCRLRAFADPEDGADFTAMPASPDGFYASGSEVEVAARPAPGFKFRRWETGEANPARVTLDAPRTLVARLEAVPYVPPTGVRNAAPGATEGPVAPGSLITISGKHLAPETVTGPEVPLAQTLGGVTVTCGERILPLLMVSPEQINAQLPSALEPGRYKLRIQGPAATEVTVDIEVVRNSPGLFAPAARANGTPVTAEAPAKPGELITVYGTGLGPYERMPLDGFPAPAPFALLDAVELSTADGWVPIPDAHASDRTGLTLLRLPAASEVRIRVNGRESNTIRIPVE